MASGVGEDVCLGDDTVARFVAGGLDGVQRTRVRSHMDVCASCRSLIADAVEIRPSDVQPEAQAPPFETVMPGRVIAGKYEILSVLGEGGMGKVLAARNVGLDQRVAIKVMHPEAAREPDAVRRFMREARAAARLKSERFVQIYDVDQLPSGLPYIVMELLDGEDLGTLQARRALGIDEALAYVIEAGEALADAHAIGLVHRDVKPQNLFLTRLAEGRSRIRVVDFGLAKELHPTAEVSAATTEQMLLGSPRYMSPEQVRSPRDVDARADVWGLGATLFMLLTGRPPFDAPSLPGLVACILADATPSARDYRPEISEQVDRVIARALEKSVELRYGNMRAFIAALRATTDEADTEVAPSPAPAPAPAATEPGIHRTVPLDVVPKRAPLHGRRSGSERFRISGSLGSGGMGQVYRAHDSVLDRPVALKVIRADRDLDDSVRRRRLVREARAAAAFTHPNTVTIFDVGEDADGVFIAMELLEGETLREVIRRGDAPLAKRLRWLRESASALAAAHERGLVHRDVKPANIFICTSGALKLLDFGVAKRAEDDRKDPTETAPESIGPSSLQTAEGRKIGTPRYMAPEQSAGMSTDARADQYGWGLVAFELLTATAGSSVAAADLGARAEYGGARIATLRGLVPGLPDPIAVAVSRALEHAKEDRLPSMAPIVELLASVELPGPQGAIRPAARRGWRIAAAAIAAITLVAGAFGAVLRARAGRPACELTASPRAIALELDDRAGLDATGAVVVARDIRRGSRLEREGRDGWTPVGLPMNVLALGPFTDRAPSGTVYMSKPSVLLTSRAGRDEGAVVTVVEPGGSSTSLRIFGPVSGLAFTSFRSATVVVATTRPGAARLANRESAVEVYRLGGERSVVELGGGGDPALAAAEHRLAIAYTSAGGLRFALLDEELAATGDITTVSPLRVAPALAFDGTVASLFWVEHRDGATRLMTSTSIVGRRGFDAPRVAVAEPVTRTRPVAVEMPGHRWGLAWVAARGDGSVLRFSAIDTAGALARPVEIASAPMIDMIQARAGAHDPITLLWKEGPTSARAAGVTCK